LKVTCCKIYLSNKIKHSLTQSRYFSNTKQEILYDNDKKKMEFKNINHNIEIKL